MLITQYQIISKDKKWIYNGHTEDYDRRINEHYLRCDNINGKYYNKKLYLIIRENGGFDNFEFIILEEHIVENKKEAFIRERFWFDTLQSNMNCNLPYRTIEDNKKYVKEYQQTEKRKEYCKEYQQTEQYKKYQKQYKKTEQYKNFIKTKITCECGSIINIMCIARHQKTKKHINSIH